MRRTERAAGRKFVRAIRRKYALASAVLALLLIVAPPARVGAQGAKSRGITPEDYFAFELDDARRERHGDDAGRTERLADSGRARGDAAHAGLAPPARRRRGEARHKPQERRRMLRLVARRQAPRTHEPDGAGRRESAF